MDYCWRPIRDVEKLNIRENLAYKFYVKQKKILHSAYIKNY